MHRSPMHVAVHRKNHSVTPQSTLCSLHRLISAVLVVSCFALRSPLRNFSCRVPSLPYCVAYYESMMRPHGVSADLSHSLYSLGAADDYPICHLPLRAALYAAKGPEPAHAPYPLLLPPLHYFRGRLTRPPPGRQAYPNPNSAAVCHIGSARGGWAWACDGSVWLARLAQSVALLARSWASD